jgi:hypothetical protein
MAEETIGRQSDFACGRAFNRDRQFVVRDQTVPREVGGPHDCPLAVSDHRLGMEMRLRSVSSKVIDQAMAGILPCQFNEPLRHLPVLLHRPIDHNRHPDPAAEALSNEVEQVIRPIAHRVR